MIFKNLSLLFWKQCKYYIIIINNSLIYLFIKQNIILFPRFINYFFPFKYLIFLFLIFLSFFTKLNLFCSKIFLVFVIINKLIFVFLLIGKFFEYLFLILSFLGIALNKFLCVLLSKKEFFFCWIEKFLLFFFLTY